MQNKQPLIIFVKLAEYGGQYSPRSPREDLIKDIYNEMGFETDNDRIVRAYCNEDMIHKTAIRVLERAKGYEYAFFSYLAEKGHENFDPSKIIKIIAEVTNLPQLTVPPSLYGKDVRFVKPRLELV